MHNTSSCTALFLRPRPCQIGRALPGTSAMNAPRAQPPTPTPAPRSRRCAARTALAPRWTRWILNAKRASPSRALRRSACGRTSRSTSSTRPGMWTSRSRCGQCVPGAGGWLLGWTMIWYGKVWVVVVVGGACRGVGSTDPAGKEVGKTCKRWHAAAPLPLYRPSTRTACIHTYTHTQPLGACLCSSILVFSAKDRAPPHTPHVHIPRACT
eukprot:357012-Chlamydomonas_euryale.AAC.3